MPLRVPAKHSPAWIRYKLAEAGKTLAALARESRLPEWACRHALRGKHRDGERAIAKFLGLSLHELWPSRWSVQGRPKDGRLAAYRPVRGPTGQQPVASRDQAGAA